MPSNRPIRNGHRTAGTVADSGQPKQRRVVQGQMWDHISLADYGTELGMQDVLCANADHADMLDLPGGLVLTVPAKAVTPEETPPPWEL